MNRSVKKNLEKILKTCTEGIFGGILLKTPRGIPVRIPGRIFVRIHKGISEGISEEIAEEIYVGIFEEISKGTPGCIPGAILEEILRYIPERIPGESSQVPIPGVLVEFLKVYLKDLHISLEDFIMKSLKKYFDKILKISQKAFL